MADDFDPVSGLYIVIKQPGEDRVYDFEFQDIFSTGDTIASIVNVTFINLGIITGSTDITLGTSSFNGNLGQVRISAGQDGEQYKVTFLVNTVAGDNNVEADGLLHIRDF